MLACFGASGNALGRILKTTFSGVVYGNRDAVRLRPCPPLLREGKWRMGEKCMKIYCINLRRATERWEAVQHEAARVGVVVTRLEAVDGNEPANVAALGAIDRVGPLGRQGKGTLACSLSHRHAWELIAAGGQTAIVLEDDVCLADDFAEVIAALGDMRGFDLVKLEDFGAVRDGLLVGPVQPLTARRGFRRVYQLATGGAGYALTPRGARHLLKSFEECSVPVDHFLFYPRHIRGFAGLDFALVDAPVVVQKPDTPSQISATRHASRSGPSPVRRGLYELAQAPGLLRAFLAGARLRKMPFRS